MLYTQILNTLPSRRIGHLILVIICFLMTVCCFLYFYFSQKSWNADINTRTDVFTLCRSKSECNTSQEQHSMSFAKVYQPTMNDSEKRALLWVSPTVTLPMRIYDPDGDVFISASISKSGEWEPAMIQAIKYIFQQDFHGIGQLEKKKHVFISNEISRVVISKESEHESKGKILSMVDLGCNIGVFTLTMVSASYKVLAVDGMEECLQLLATSLRKNNLTSLVTLVHNAVSDVRGPVHLQVNTKNKGASFVKQDDMIFMNNASGKLKNNLTSVYLDDLFSYVQTDRVFLKMDIEGFEAKAFRCADKFFKMVHMPYVLIEWVFHSHNYNGAYIINFLTSKSLVPYDTPHSTVCKSFSTRLL